MRIISLALHNFRCYSSYQLELPSGLSVFEGPNATGKTSLLEAIMLLATGRSPRTNWSREMVAWGVDSAQVRGLFEVRGGRQHEVQVTLARTGGQEIEKAVWLDGAAPESTGVLLQRLPAVIFDPDDLQLVKGGSSERRRFMNQALSGLRPVYLEDLMRYRRAVRQRNELLKQAWRGRASGDELAPWTTQLVRTGAQLMADREWLVGEVGPRAATLYRELSGGAEELELRYRPDVGGDEEGLPERMQAFYEALESMAAVEARRGATQVGPHRDEVRVLLGGRPARDYGSQGQQRTAALSLKLAQAQLLAAGREESPLVLLDDCLSELDENRQQQVLELVGQFEQILLTTAARPPVPVPEDRVHHLPGEQQP